MELYAGLGQLGHRVGTRCRYLGEVLLRGDFGGKLDAFLNVAWQAVEPLEVTAEHLAVWNSLGEGYVAQDVLEAEDEQCAYGWVKCISNALLNCRRRFAPSNWRWVRANEAVVLLQHLGARYTELHAIEVARRENRASTALADSNNAWVDHDVEQRLKALGFNLWVDVIDPRIRAHQVGETLVGATEVRQVDQVNRRCERREVGQRVLSRLNGAALYLLNQCTTSAKLTAWCKFHVHFAVGCVLDVFLQVQLHDRVAAGRAEHVSRSDEHGVVSSSFALTLFSSRLGNSFVGPQRASSTSNHSSRKATCCRQLQEITAGSNVQLVFRVFNFQG